VWPRSADDLVAAQDILAAASPPLWRPPEGALSVGACVATFPRGKTGAGAAGDPAWAAAVVLRGRAVIAEVVVRGEAGAPYAPGLLALREGPLHEAVVRALAQAPDVLLVDATGRDHPRRAGLALHLGAVLDLPTVGVTHRPLLAVGDEPEDTRGATAPLRLGGDEVGAWLRTRRGARPVAVHPAWRTDIGTAVQVVLAATAGHRTPEPVRHARRLARVTRSRAGRTARTASRRTS
jgi:deoxyribonuclease V